VSGHGMHGTCLDVLVFVGSRRRVAVVVVMLGRHGVLRVERRSGQKCQGQDNG